jgi:hypothetical protein
MGQRGRIDADRLSIYNCVRTFYTTEAGMHEVAVVACVRKDGRSGTLASKSRVFYIWTGKKKKRVRTSELLEKLGQTINEGTERAAAALKIKVTFVPSGLPHFSTTGELRQLGFLAHQIH